MQSNIYTHIAGYGNPSIVVHMGEERPSSPLVKELIPEYRQSPVNLFRLWLEGGKDFSQVQITLRRCREKSNEASAGKRGVKAKDLPYSDENKQIAIDYLTQKGLYMDDDLFPGNVKERWYFPTNDINFKVTAKSWESIEGTAQGDVSGADEVSAIFGDQGALAPPTDNLPTLAGGANVLGGLQLPGRMAAAFGAAPAAVPGGAAAGSADGVGTTPGQPKPVTPEEKEAKKQARAALAAEKARKREEEVSRMTTVEMVCALVVDVRKEAGEAKNLQEQLRGRALSTDMEGQMGQHSRFMYAMANRLQAMTDKGEQNMSAYQGLLARLDAAMQWYSLRRTSAQGFLRPYAPAKKAKEQKASSPASA